MKILIVGATGATGKLLVDQLLEYGHEVKAFARTVHSSNNRLPSVPISPETSLAALDAASAL